MWLSFWQVSSGHERADSLSVYSWFFNTFTISSRSASFGICNFCTWCEHHLFTMLANKVETGVRRSKRLGFSNHHTCTNIHTHFKGFFPSEHGLANWIRRGELVTTYLISWLTMYLWCQHSSSTTNVKQARMCCDAHIAVECINKLM